MTELFVSKTMRNFPGWIENILQFRTYKPRSGEEIFYNFRHREEKFCNYRYYVDFSRQDLTHSGRCTNCDDDELINDGLRENSHPPHTKPVDDDNNKEENVGEKKKRRGKDLD